MTPYTDNLHRRFMSYLQENGIKNTSNVLKGGSVQVDFTTEDEEHFDELSEIAGVDPQLVKRDGKTWRVTFV